jgi:hypothetical protein
MLPARAPMTAPTGDLACRLVEAVAGSRPLEVEIAADADPRRGWLVRAWFADGALRDYRLHVEVVPGLAEEERRERLVESTFERWPPPTIRGGMRRCRCGEWS